MEMSKDFQTKFLSKAAAIDPLSIHANVIANSACKPKKGVKDIDIHMLNPLQFHEKILSFF